MSFGGSSSPPPLPQTPATPPAPPPQGQPQGTKPKTTASGPFKTAIGTGDIAAFAPGTGMFTSSGPGSLGGSGTSGSSGSRI